MHRFGQRLRRELLKRSPPASTHNGAGQDHPAPQPQSSSHSQPPTTDDDEDSLLSDFDRDLRARLDKFDGQQIQDGIRGKGVEAVLEAMGATERDLRDLQGEEGKEEEMKERVRVRELAIRIWKEEWGDELGSVASGVGERSERNAGLEMRR